LSCVASVRHHPFFDTHLSTQQVADQLGIGLARIFNSLRARKLRPPAKGPTGTYWWSPADVAALRKALATDGRRCIRLRRLRAEEVLS
jgi:hypothetical protein